MDKLPEPNIILGDFNAHTAGGATLAATREVV